ncbi:MAG: single-stranded-DNA-specific exonuclease RecJ, partial [Candidatus Binatia bacterium]
MSAAWSIRQTDDVAAAALAGETGLSLLVARLLLGRGLGEPAAAAAFLDASLSRTLRSPMLFREMRVAAGRLLEAVRKRERVFIYGDYDVD